MIMDLLHKLEAAVENLLQRNRQLSDENTRLREAEKHWLEERRDLQADIDRILERIDQAQKEEP